MKVQTRLKKFCWDATGGESETDVIISMVIPTNKGNMIVGVAAEGDIKEKALATLNENFGDINDIFDLLEDFDEDKNSVSVEKDSLTIHIIGMSLIGISIISFIVLIVLDLCNALI